MIQYVVLGQLISHKGKENPCGRHWAHAYLQARHENQTLGCLAQHICRNSEELQKLEQNQM